MLTSLQNPLVKQLRKLRSPRSRRQENLLLLEGTHLLASACEVSCPLTAVCATPAWLEKHPQLWQQATLRSPRVEVVSASVLEAIATTVSPDGVVAAAVRGGIHRSPKAEIGLGLVLERLQDPGNLGTIIRTSVATGVEGVWLSDDSVDLDNPKVLRASAGEWFRLPIATTANLKEAIAASRAAGMQAIATVPKATSTYWDIDFQKPTLILLGNEGAGLSPELTSCADRQVTIPLSAGVESLNVAIATALLLYEAQRQRTFQSSVTSDQ